MRRNLKSVAKLSKAVDLTVLRKTTYRDLLVISEVYRQQRPMFDQRNRRINDRIWSISQPHLRPIKRGKAGSYRIRPDRLYLFFEEEKINTAGQ